MTDLQIRMRDAVLRATGDIYDSEMAVEYLTEDVPEVAALLNEGKFPSEPVNEDGWTIWIEPLPGYLLQCCDCGLTHEMQFRVEKGAIQFRAKVVEEPSASN